MQTFDVLALRKLSSLSKNTKIGRIRLIFSEIEDLITAGVSYKKILEELNSQGLEVSMTHFKNMIYILRKQRDRKNTAAVVTKKSDPEIETIIPSNGPEVIQHVEVVPIGQDSVSATEPSPKATTKSIRAIFNKNVDISEFM